MAKIPLRTSRVRTLAAGATNYFTLSAGGVSNSTTEANVQRKAQGSADYTKLGIYITVNGMTTDGSLTFRKNGADGTQTVVITAGVTGWFECTGTDSIVAGDLICFKVVAGATAGLTMTLYGPLFSPASDTVTIHGLTAGSTTTDSLAHFLRYSGDSASPQTTRAAIYPMKFKVAGVIRNLTVMASTYTRSTNSDIKSDRAGATGNLVITASNPVQYEDITNTDTVSVNDEVCRQILTSTGGGTFGYGIYNEFVTTTGKTQLIAGPDLTLNASATTYVAVQGTGSSTTAADVSMIIGVACVISLGNLFNSTNTIVGDSTITLQKNGSDTAIVLTIAGLASGAWIEEASPTTVTYAATDTISWKCVGGAAGTAAVIRLFGLVLDTNVAVNAKHPAINSGVVTSLVSGGLAR